MGEVKKVKEDVPKSESIADPRPRFTDAQYLKELQNTSNEVLDAIAVFHTYEEINLLALEDPAVYQALNKDADFWMVIAHSLQTTLFITLARIFDTGPNAHSIHRFVNITVGHPHLFSREALKARRIAMNGRKQPEWIGEFLNGTWEPNGSADLRSLKKELAPHAKKFEEVYRPIRHTFIAHRAVNIEEVSQLFQRTNRAELGEILDFLHDLTDAIWQLYNNGIRPELGRRSASYKSHNQEIRERTKRLIYKLVFCQR
jgi:hypothetical protein